MIGKKDKAAMKMKTDARLSADRKYRYALWRIWDETGPHVMFIGLNPSTANETEDDPTIRRCIGFAKSWGYGGLIMANLFGYRATDPKEMQKALDPIGQENDKWLHKLTKEAELIVGAWGDGGLFQDRGNIVMGMFSNVHCLKMNKSGQPAHPLYLSSNLHPKPISE